MAVLKNLPKDKPLQIASMIQTKANQIVSMALSDSEHIQMMLFAFADKETVSEEEYFGDTMYLVIEGEAIIKQKENAHFLKAGDVFFVPSHTLHSIGGKESFKLLQITISE